MNVQVAVDVAATFLEIKMDEVLQIGKQAIIKSSIEYFCEEGDI